MAVGKIKNDILWIFDRLGYFLNGPYSEKDTIIIAGAPRSGTTWVMNLMESLENYKAVFEPFNTYWYKNFSDLNINKTRPYLDINEDYPPLRKYLLSIFRGEISGRAPDYEFSLNEIHKKVFAKKQIVKFVRANRLLPWIARNFSVRAIYLVLRHPCATIASQLKTGWIGYPAEIERSIREGNPDIKKIKRIIWNEISVIKNFYYMDEIIDVFKQAETVEEHLAIEWSLDYLIPLYYLKKLKFDWYVVIYERLLVDIHEVENMFRYINEKKPSTIKENIKRPSKTSMMDSKTINRKKQLVKWKKSLKKEQIARILNIVEHLGLNFYTQNPLPDFDKLNDWLP